jgi:hypothetical protein
VNSTNPVSPLLSKSADSDTFVDNSTAVLTRIATESDRQSETPRERVSSGTGVNRRMELKAIFEDSVTTDLIIEFDAGFCDDILKAYSTVDSNACDNRNPGLSIRKLPPAY